MAQTQTFRATTLQEAIALVKRELGPHAEIVATSHVSIPDPRRADGRRIVEIVARRGKDEAAHVSARLPEKRSAPRVAARATADDSVADTESCYARLVQSEVAEDIARQIAVEVASTGGIDARATLEALRRRIAAMIPSTGGVSWKPGTLRRVALVGPAGAGKTTTLVKLAAQLKMRQNARVTLLSLDVHRLAAHEQLRRYAEIIGFALHTAQTVQGVRDVVERFDAADVLLIDTPGVGQRDAGRFARLAALLRAVRPDETHLVLPASLSTPAQVRAAALFAPLGVTRVALTHLDEVVGLGVVLNVAERLKLGLSYLACGQRVPSDLEEACGKHLAGLILSA